MRKIQILFTAMVAVVMSSCVQFKTEATVDIEVTQKGKPLVGATVYKIPSDRSPLYKDNATGTAITNAGGIAHFDLKSPEDLDPSNVAGVSLDDQATFHFCTYDAEGTQNAIVTVTVKTGDKLTLKLDVPEGLVNGDEI